MKSSKINLSLIMLFSILISCGKKQGSNNQKATYITEKSLEDVFFNKFNENDSIKWFKMNVNKLKNDLLSLDSIDLSNYIEQSSKLSDFYAVDKAKINFKRSRTLKLGEKDTLFVIPELRLSQMLNRCYLGNIDSLRYFEDYRKKNEIIEYEIKFEIPTSKLGNNKIEGMYELNLLDNSKELVPFLFEYEVVK